MKKLKPYIYTIIIFNILFIITMLVDNNYLYFGLGGESWQVEANNKIQLQRWIFEIGLAFIITIVVFIEALLSTRKLKHLLIKATSTVTLIYFINLGIFELLGQDIICLYNDHDKTPSILELIIPVFFVIIIVILLEFFSWTEFYNKNKHKIITRLPESIKWYYK